MLPAVLLLLDFTASASDAPAATSAPHFFMMMGIGLLGLSLGVA